MRVRLQSKAGISWCMRRLADATDRPSLNPLDEWRSNTKAMVAHVSPQRIELYRRGLLQNGAAPRFYGKLRSIPEGTIIEGRIGLRPLFIATYALMLIFELATAIIIFNEHAPYAISHGENPWLILWPIAWIGFAPALVIGISLFATRTLPAHLLDFLKRTLEAEEMPQE